MNPIHPVSLDDEIAQVHAQSFGYVLAHVHGLFNARLADALQGTGLHMGQVVVLATLWTQRELHQESTLTQTRLAQASGIEKSSLVLFLDALEKDGWVERRRHPTDRRAHIVHLTDSGAARFAEVGVRLQKRQQENLSVLTAQEQADMLRQLTRLLRHLQGE